MLRILHVDDDWEDRKLVKFYLSKLEKDLEITEAADLDSATKILEEQQIDCVLCDFRMRNIDGITFINRIKPEHPDIPIVLLTGQGDERIAAKALREGADDYLIKDTSTAHFEHLLHSLKRVVKVSLEKQKRREAELQLKESEATARVLLNAPHIAIVMIDEAGTILDVNQTQEKEYDLPRDQIIGKNIWDVSNTSCNELLKKNFAVAVSDNKMVQFEHVDQESGHQIAIIPSGELKGRKSFTIFTYDITDRLKLEHDLKEEEQKYRALVENNTDLIIRLSLEGKILYCNPAIEKYYEVKPEALINTSLNKVDHFKNLLPVIKKYLKIVKTTKDLVETELFLKTSKGEFTNHIRIIPEMDSKREITSYLLTLIDLTSEKLAEQRYEILFDRMLDAFAIHEMIFDKDGKPCDYKFLAVNPAFEELTGLSADMVTGKRVLEVLPDTEEFWIETYGNVVTTGQAIRFDSFSREIGRYFEVVAFTFEENRFATIFTDITERVTAQREVKKSEIEYKNLSKTLEKERSLLRDLINSIPDAIFFKDPDGRIIGCNDALAKQQSTTVDKLINKTDLDYFDEDKAHRHIKEDREIIESGEQIRVVEERTDSFGVTRIFDKIKTPYLGPDGDVLGIIGIMRDVTELRKALEDVRKEKEKAQNYLDVAAVTLIVLDTIGTITLINKKGCKLLGLSEEEIVGKNWFRDYVHESEVINLVQFREKLSQGEVSDAEIEYSIRNESGNTRLVVANTSILRDEKGEIVGQLNSIKDITEQRMAEKSLIESERNLRTLFQAAENVAFIVIDIDEDFGRIIDFSPGAQNIFKISKENAKKKSFLDFCTTEAVDLLVSELEEFKSGDSLSSTETRLIKEDSSIFWAVLSARSLKFDRQNINAALIIILDVDEMKYMQAEARIKEQQLIQAGKMASLGFLVSGVAHEINNPNQFIMSNVTIIKEFIDGAKPVLDNYYEEYGDFSIGGISYQQYTERLETILKGVVSGSERIKQIVKELRQFAMPSTIDHLENVDLNAVLRSSVVLLTNVIKKSTEKFEIDYCKGIPVIQGNSQKLEQVVINLISNACQALSNRNQAIKVATGYDELKKGVFLTVEDEGEGMDESVLEHITDPFFTTRRNSGGTGLGLSISSTIVKDHDGLLLFDSSQNAGTRATLFLPVTK